MSLETNYEKYMRVKKNLMFMFITLCMSALFCLNDLLFKLHLYEMIPPICTYHVYLTTNSDSDTALKNMEKTRRN